MPEKLQGKRESFILMINRVRTGWLEHPVLFRYLEFLFLLTETNPENQ